jgi:hypothetical protein
VRPLAMKLACTLAPSVASLRKRFRGDTLRLVSRA